MKKALLFFSFMLFALIAKATVYGPYDMDEVTTQPDGYTKVVVFSQPGSIGGYIILENVSTGEQVTLTAITNSMCYYYIESGYYEVAEIQATHDALFGGSYLLEVGDTLMFSGGAAIIFTRGLIEY